MRRDSKIKMLSIILLVFAIIGMTLGFASFSSILNITSSATVSPNSDDFKVVLSGSATDSTVTAIDYVAENGATASAGVCVGVECYTSNVLFTEPGQKVTYVAYIHNVGKYTSYFRTIEFDYVDGTQSKKVCSAIENGGASQSLVESACSGIRIYCQNPFGEFYDNYDFTQFNELSVGSVVPVYTIIEYQEGAASVDGPFNVQFGRIKLVINSSNA